MESFISETWPFRTLLQSDFVPSPSKLLLHQSSSLDVLLRRTDNELQEVLGIRKSYPKDTERVRGLRHSWFLIPYPLSRRGHSLARESDSVWVQDQGHRGVHQRHRFARGRGSRGDWFGIKGTRAFAHYLPGPAHISGSDVKGDWFEGPAYRSDVGLQKGLRHLIVVAGPLWAGIAIRVRRGMVVFSRI